MEEVVIENPNTPTTKECASENDGEASAKESYKKDENYNLRIVIKENHDSAIHGCAFNFADPRYSNLLATVGGGQMNIYDNEHFGNYLDLMMHFVNKDTPLTPKIDKENYLTLKTCCWVRAAGTAKELVDDAYLAVGGDDQLIHIISLKRSKVITVLKGHSNSITCLSAHPTKPELLLSASLDGTIKLWNIHAEKGKKCVQTWQEKASSLCFLKEGKKFLFGSSDGRITELDTENPNFSFLAPIKAAKAVDCIKLLDKNVVASRSTDGKITIWDRDSQCSVNVTISGPGGNTKFDVSQDKQLLCVGSASGRVYVFDAVTGKRLHELEYKRCRKEVKECAFTKDSKSIVFVTADTHIWRFDKIVS